jgi:hypothetical protein
VRVQRSALGRDVGPAIEARERDRGVVFGEFRVGAGGDRGADRAVIWPIEIDPEIGEAPDRVRERCVARDHESALTSRKRLGRVQAEDRAGRLDRAGA